MSTFTPGPRPAAVPAPRSPALAGSALGLTLAGPALFVGSPVLSLSGAGALVLLAGPSVLAGLAVGIVALVRAGRGGPGRGLAIAAVVTSAALITATALAFVVLVVLFALAGS